MAQDIIVVDGAGGDLPGDLEFVPVPRRGNRWNGLTAQRQRRFIALLAETGSVTMAAKGIGSSPSSLYQLRQRPGAEDFARVWELAVERATARVFDIMVEHAIHGTPEQIYRDGELVAEKRHYNHRSMMWILAHNQPERFGQVVGDMHGRSYSRPMEKLRAKWRAEWEEERAAEREREDAERARRVAEPDGEYLMMVLALYRVKLKEERFYRREGHVVAADFALRQALMAEMMLILGGEAGDRIEAVFRQVNAWPIEALYADNVQAGAYDDGKFDHMADRGEYAPYSPVMARLLHRMREFVWAEAGQEGGAEAGQMARPEIHYHGRPLPDVQTYGGDDFDERHRVREEAQLTISAAQARWEAAATTERWAMYKEGRI